VGAPRQRCARTDPGPAVRSALIRFDHITFAYRADDAGRPALRDVTLAVEPGRHVAVLGANGCGKSTLVRLVNGMLLPGSGEVTVDGMDTRDEARSLELRQRVGIVFQRPDDQIVATSVEDDVAFGPENLGLPREEIRARVDEALAAVGMTGFEQREPHTLSGGQKQRLAIAGALAMRPAYLVLDEPTSMLDSAGRQDVLGIVRRLHADGTGILHVTHDLGAVLGADEAFVLDAGEIAFSGSFASLLDAHERLEEWGLELPAVGRLALALAALGVPIGSPALDPESMAVALWG
jgi:energy-coupling factor transport system ATP-binding protein